MSNISIFNCVYVFRSASCCKDTKNTCSCSNIKYYLILEVFFVVFNSSLISKSSDSVLEHFLVDIEVGVASEIIVMVLLDEGEVCTD